MKIDVVIPWVDGNDPVLNSKRSKYAVSDELQCMDVGGATRYSNLGEILWCVVSINRFASFINKIYIVTDEQDPHLDGPLSEFFPEGYIPVEIVDHKTIFEGYEEYLPVFNSVSIETMIWRIPGLSEHFLLMNDDFILVDNVREEDFFTADGKVICYARKFSTAWARLLRKLKPKVNSHEVVTFKSSMISALDMLGGGSFFYYLVHSPRPLLKSFFEGYFANHPETIIKNIRHRFRNIDQFSSQELLYLSFNRDKKLKLINAGPKAFYCMPKPKKDYVEKKLAKLSSGQYLFCCFNSLDLAGDGDRRKIIDWVSRRLDIRIPE